MTKTETVSINFRGGVISPGYLHEILHIAGDCGVKQVRFGLRQQLIMNIPVKKFAFFEQQCSAGNIPYTCIREAAPNIVSSYPAAGIFTSDNWLREGVYKDIFDAFEQAPSLKINICDSTQSLVPFFTGHINWVSASAAHFWHLYLRFPRTQTVYCWPDLVYTNDISRLTAQLEKTMLAHGELFYGNTDASGPQLYELVKACGPFVSKKRDEALVLPRFSLPYYEGMNSSGNSLWLGIYRRDEWFPVALLREICTICLDTRIGQLYTTPWKSIIIKGIERQHADLWDYTLGQHRINVRHAANELNWQVEDNNEEGLLLKRFLIRHFDKEDIRTSGLSFAIQTKPTSRMFGSVIVRKQAVKNPGRLKSLERFDVLHTTEFNPNSSELQLFREGVEKEHLGTYLASLCKHFYQQEGTRNLDIVPGRTTPAAPVEKEAAPKMVHQCRHCWTVYDEAIGEPLNGIPPGTSFSGLPTSYQCPLCESGIEAFKPVAASALHLQGH